MRTLQLVILLMLEIKVTIYELNAYNQYEHLQLYQKYLESTLKTSAGAKMYFFLKVLLGEDRAVTEIFITGIDTFGRTIKKLD